MDPADVYHWIPIAENAEGVLDNQAEEIIISLELRILLMKKAVIILFLHIIYHYHLRICLLQYWIFVQNKCPSQYYCYHLFGWAIITSCMYCWYYSLISNSFLRFSLFLKTHFWLLSAEKPPEAVIIVSLLTCLCFALRLHAKWRKSIGKYSCTMRF